MAFDKTDLFHPKSALKAIHLFDGCLINSLRPQILFDWHLIKPTFFTQNLPQEPFPNLMAV
ncbi:MAG: hypothetical protein H6581_03180 [Bacteroidia bacterium]|nr:hypothetical protein [Bacteroidia bacterium]